MQIPPLICGVCGSYRELYHSLVSALSPPVLFASLTRDREIDRIPKFCTCDLDLTVCRH